MTTVEHRRRDRRRRPGPRRPATGRRVGRRACVNVFSHGFLLLWALLTALPLLWASSARSRATPRSSPTRGACPARCASRTGRRAWTEAHIGQYFLNSAVVVAGSLTLTMLLGATAAYVFARYEFRGRQLVYYLFVGGMMFPVFLALVPLFFVVRNIGLFGTWTGLILVYAAYSLPFTVFFLTAFFRTLPTSVAEAAMIDGCGHFRLFFRVMLPMARPGLISVGIFNFLSQWNQFILPQVLMQGDESKWVLAQGLAALAVSQGYQGDFSGLFAGLTLAMLPVLGGLCRLPTPDPGRADRRPAPVTLSVPADPGRLRPSGGGQAPAVAGRTRADRGTQPQAGNPGESSHDLFGWSAGRAEQPAVQGGRVGDLGQGPGGEPGGGEGAVTGGRAAVPPASAPRAPGGPPGRAGCLR